MPEINPPLAALPEAYLLPDVQGREYLPAAYRAVDPQTRGPRASQRPRNVFIEVTNHCNLLCETCPRTFVSYEQPQTLSWDNFLRVAAQFPEMERAVLHGIGEPLLNKELDRMIAHLKTRGVFVLFNTNATLLDAAWARKLIAAGLDELRVSIDGANPRTYAQIRGAPLFNKVLQNVQRFVALQRELGADRPRTSLWMTGLKENIAELPDVIRIAARLGVGEVYLQRMVYYENANIAAPGLLESGHGLYASFDAQVDAIVAASELLAQELGVALRASGATSVKRSVNGSTEPRPWAACMRPWTTAYITANGNALPCCISPFATSDYHSLILGNLFEQPFDAVWNAERYRAWRERLLSDNPNTACAGCGVHWSL
jgi:MoaA/NifB/PqqE/SkfB family radical SAM enzyme